MNARATTILIFRPFTPTCGACGQCETCAGLHQREMLLAALQERLIDAIEDQYLQDGGRAYLEIRKGNLS